MVTPVLERLLVRLGYEIYMPHIKAAMEESNVEGMYNERVFVNLPWESEALALSNKLSATIDELKASNAMQARQLAAAAEQDRVEEGPSGAASAGEVLPGH